MGPQEKRLTRELAVSLIRSCSRALLELPPNTTLDIAAQRRWFAQAYREWQLTPRVDLVGRSPYEVIAAERAAARAHGRVGAEPTIEVYTDLPNPDCEYSSDLPLRGDVASPQIDAAVADGRSSLAPPDSRPPLAQQSTSAAWRHLANRLLAPWLDDELNRL